MSSMNGMTCTVRTVDAEGLPSPQIEVVFAQARYDWSARRTVLLRIAAGLQQRVPSPRQWGALAVPSSGDDLGGRVLLTGVMPTELHQARAVLERFVAGLVSRPTSKKLYREDRLDDVSEDAFEELLKQLVCAELAMEDDASLGAVRTFAEAGAPTNTRGLVVQLGACEFQVSVVRRR